MINYDGKEFKFDEDHSAVAEFMTAYIFVESVMNAKSNNLALVLRPGTAMFDYLEKLVINGENEAAGVLKKYCAQEEGK